MSNGCPSHLSASKQTLLEFIHKALVPHGVEVVWVVGSRSGRFGRKPNIDSDWDLEVSGPVKSRKLPLPADYGLYGEVHMADTVKEGATMAYPTWKVNDDI